MDSLQIALEYMRIVFSDKESPKKLLDLLSDDCKFNGPLFQFESASEYVQSLLQDPPKGFSFDLIKSFQDESSACLVYLFSKPGITTTMTQLFEVNHGKITKILLVFDTKAFS